jgi:hypothetical protein
VNDRVAVISAALQSAFNGDEGTACCWMKVNPGVWTDSTVRIWYTINVFGNNYIQLYKHSVNNTLTFYYRAGGVFEVVNHTMSDASWFHAAITWSASADKVRAFINGAQVGVDQTGLGVWAGVPVSSFISNAGATWHGWEAHMVLFDSAQSDATIADLATV